MADITTFVVYYYTTTNINPKNKEYLTIKQAINFLLENHVHKDTLAIACARLGSKNYFIKSGTLNSLKNKTYGLPPYCLIIPSKELHFVEEEMFQYWG